MTPDDPRLPPPGDAGSDMPDPAGGTPGSPVSGPGDPSATGPGGDPVASGPGGREGDDADPDVLASALLDGALDDADAAAARQRPDVMARMAEIESTRAALRGAPVPPPDPGVRERAIAAALAAFDDAASPPAARAPVRDLTARQYRRGPRRRGTPRWLGAAAAVAVLAAAAAGLATLGTSSDSDDVATSAGAPDAGGSASEGAQEESGAAADAPASGGGADDETLVEEVPPGAPLAAGELGSFASADDLVADLRTRAARDADSTGATDGGGEAAASAGDLLPDLRSGCGTDLPGPLEDGDAVVRLWGTATLRGGPVDVLVIRTPDGDRVVALDAGCNVVIDEPLG
ncbi:MAG TPA: hypothetical protein VFH36_15520 [Acidimicrobiales bacterium]|nr:hypothetical protein [Acidimicrobiales bacterium]